MNSGDGCSNTCQNEALTCDTLGLAPVTLTHSGGSVTATCQGTNESQYKFVLKQGSTVINTVNYQTSSQTTFTLPANTTASAISYSVQCYVKNSYETDITNTNPNTCIQPITVPSQATTPSISITKDDAETPHNDTQQVVTNGTATFTIVVTNNGTEALNNVIIADTYASNCDRTSAQTASSYSGGVSTNFDPGESFTYTCTKTNVVNGTFPNNTNTILVTGRGVGSNILVTDDDPTTITLTTAQTPQILINKSDINTADIDGSLGNDTQTVNQGSRAVFRIRVTNNGTEDLKNIVLTDTVAPNCGGNVSLPSSFPGTWSGWSVGGSGNLGDGLLQPGEYFEYTCEKTNTTGAYTNSATVNAQGNTSNTPVTSTDPTYVLVQNVTTPQILINKSDINTADIDGSLGNDTQTVNQGSRAVFRIRVTNNGTEDLKNIVLTDTVAPNCGGNVSLPSSFPGTWSGWSVGGSGNLGDGLLQPGEYFEYTCEKTNTTGAYTNSATVNAQGNTSNTPVTSTDPTYVLVQNVENPATCNELFVDVEGTNIYYSCTSNRTDVTYSIRMNGNVISSVPYGNTNATYGTHTLQCFVNGNITSQLCSKTVVITPPTPTNPRIEIVKDDNDNRDDQQNVQR